MDVAPDAVTCTPTEAFAAFCWLQSVAVSKCSTAEWESKDIAHLLNISAQDAIGNPPHLFVPAPSPWVIDVGDDLICLRTRWLGTFKRNSCVHIWNKMSCQ